MAKKNYNIVKIRAPEIKNDGKAVRFDVSTQNNETVSLTINSQELPPLIEALVQILGSLRIRKAIPETYKSIAEFQKMPTPFHVSDVNLVSLEENGAISVEAKDLQGRAVHLHFLPAHFQFFLKVVEKINTQPPPSGVH
jgi:hypothetical protein